MRDALLAGAIIAVTWSLGHLAGLHRLEPVGYLLAMALGGNHFLREGLHALRHERAVGIEVLMATAAAGAAGLGLWDEAALLVFLYATAEALEEYAYARTRSAIRSLLALAPQDVCVLRDGREETVPATQLRRGDRFVVRPGQVVATDGIIRDGTSALDESPVTGESTPVDKGPGDRVFAGSINRHGALVVEATATFEDNTLARIVHLVEEAQERKGRLQRVIERFGRRYSPGVLAAAVLLAVVPPLVGQPAGPWVLRAVVLLVAAAPCALVMSTPVAVAAGIGSAGRHGILVKGGVHLENLGRIRAVAFDKTGTLTEGRPQLTDVIPAPGVARDDVLALAASVEQRSEHPLGKAIVRRAGEEGVALAAAAEFTALAGLGARARVDGRVAVVGTPAALEQEGVALGPLVDAAAALQAQGKTVVAVAADGVALGLLALHDRPRADAAAAIAALHRLGVTVVMLTGDHARTADAVARDLGIDRVYASLSPEDKVTHIRQLEEALGPVAMVGDGINDAPALAAATVGIAMGAAGTDAAIEAADVALMADDLVKVAEAIRLGRVVRAISLQNLVFSLLVLSVLIPAALLGAITVVAAIVVHEVSELLAVANGLRAARPLPA
ncbi:MAG: cation-translocating P-type ATPase [Armatimonadota bacterium]|nr:cation-translocating P-type ATPase [Armatimonadota bacterium]